MHLIRAAAGILAGGCAGRAGRHKGVARVVLAAWSRTCRRAMHLGCLVSTLSRVTPDGWRRQSGQDANNEPPVQVPVLRRVREEGRARVEGGQLAQVPRRGRGPAARPGLRPPAAAAAAASAQQGQAHAHGPRCAGPRTDEREGEEPQVAKINCKESLGASEGSLPRTACCRPARYSRDGVHSSSAATHCAVGLAWRRRSLWRGRRRATRGTSIPIPQSLAQPTSRSRARPTPRSRWCSRTAPHMRLLRRRATRRRRRRCTGRYVPLSAATGEPGSHFKVWFWGG